MVLWQLRSFRNLFRTIQPPHSPFHRREKATFTLTSHRGVLYQAYNPYSRFLVIQTIPMQVYQQELCKYCGLDETITNQLIGKTNEEGQSRKLVSDGDRPWEKGERE